MILEHLGQPNWAGYSLGGGLLLNMATTAPGRTGRSVLLEPVLDIPAELAMHRLESL